MTTLDHSGESPLVAPEELADLAQQALDQARQAGADAAEVSLSVSRALTVSVRQQELEDVEFQHDHDVSVAVYYGEQRASASSTEITDSGLREAVASACEMARFTEADPWQGLADPDRLANDFPDLELEHPWDIDVPAATDIALACEQAAFDTDSRISNSEGASVDTHHGLSFYANSQGFAGYHRGTRHSIDCTVLAGEGEALERDYDYTADRNPRHLLSPAAVGQSAARRALRRLDPQSLKTGSVPVLFEPRLARGLFARFISAISGGALYRKASFLLDASGQQLFPAFIQIAERPHLPGAIGSANFDSEGVATRNRELVTHGVLDGYILGSYSARRLGLETTGNAGGTHNLLVAPGDKSFDALVKEMDTGLIVTEMMGQGANMLTGDYSRGAAGLWVENGEIAYAVDELTVAGNLRDMYRDIRAMGSDIDSGGNIRCGSLLIDGMMVAGA